MQTYILNKLPLAIYKTMDIAIYIKNKESLYLWANDFFIQKSLGYLSKLIRKITDITKVEIKDIVTWLT